MGESHLEISAINDVATNRQVPAVGTKLYAGTYTEANIKKSATIIQMSADMTSVALGQNISRFIVSAGIF
jgi:hypothetical protein